MATEIIFFIVFSERTSKIMYDETETRYQNDQSYNNYGFKFWNGESMSFIVVGIPW